MFAVADCKVPDCWWRRITEGPLLHLRQPLGQSILFGTRSGSQIRGTLSRKRRTE
jgi:hypothetical protein